ncbi:hypothetical protein BGZ51_006523 [Haplosporangium sp. Z 767]|nr:hypothetical protein BGZ51_006523 [Haplosporangium sp. Z 767]
MTGNQAFGTSGTTGLESLESLASLSVMSPTLPMPSSMSASTGRRNSTGASGGSGGYFSSSFQPVQSLPVIYQNQATTSFGQSSNGLGNDNSNNGGAGGGGSASFLSSQNQGQSQDMFSSFQGSKAQQYQHHRQQVPSFPLSSSLSSSLPAHSGFHHYSLQQQPQNRHYLQQQQPSHLSSQDLSQSHTSSQSSSSVPPFSREVKGRSRSASITGVSTTSTSTDTTTTAPTTMPFGNTNVRDNTTTSSPSTNPVLSKIKVPERPRTIPPRPPQASAPRKYHGRQVRKAPNPSIDHHQVSGLSGLVPPTRRLAHIMSEQKRREKINAGFEELKTVIPE